MEDTLLSSSVTAAQYRGFETNKDRARIAKFVLQRFSERYIAPLRCDRHKRHGFCTMAISCLMVEALESFWQGWPDTNNTSRNAFRSFFKRCREQGSKLGMFAEHVDGKYGFYTGVRCGILHQAETTGGWRIRRNGPLFDIGTKTVNASKFHRELEARLRSYCGLLQQSDWDDDVWRRLREKMVAVIEHCKAGG